MSNNSKLVVVVGKEEEEEDEQQEVNVQYEQDGPEAQVIAQHLPYFPFKGISRFYDIGGFLAEPQVFQKIVHIFSNRYKTSSIDVVAGLDARGFILGPPIALVLKKPFIMIRKPGKMPNTISSQSYLTEYGEREGLTIQRDKVKPGDRVLIVDDLVATGGTLASAIQLIQALGGIVAECCCVVELKHFAQSRRELFQKRNIDHVSIWGLVSEDILTVEGQLPDDYVDDGDEDHSLRASVYR